MSLLTNWGYTLVTAETLPVAMTVQEFNTLTGGKYTGDTRIEPEIKSASLALQNRCGWHLFGTLACKISWTVKNRGIIFTGRDMLIQLPARMVTGITSVKIADVETTDYSLQPNGLLTVYDVSVSDRRNVVEVVYTAGIANESALQSLVAEMVIYKLVKSYGVTSEAAGGVSITYNSSWTNGSFDRIFDNNAALITPYRLEGVF